VGKEGARVRTHLVLLPPYCKESKVTTVEYELKASFWGRNYHMETSGRQICREWESERERGPDLPGTEKGGKERIRTQRTRVSSGPWCQVNMLSILFFTLTRLTDFGM